LKAGRASDDSARLGIVARVGACARTLPVEAGRSGFVTVRRWRVEDADALCAAVSESLESLAPWMAWVHEPLFSPAERRLEIALAQENWATGTEARYGIFVGDTVAGSCGLHRRLGPDGLELGYWLHPRFSGRGIATLAAAMLTDAAFTLGEIELVEIHHDRANTRSRAIPERLGYRLIAEVPDPPEAPGEIGIECQWRVTREEWEPGAWRGDPLRGAQDP
jgi:RimJ/RimL family protein N-acetyltransferase